jgi:lysyl-tRNA synthetase class I
VFLVLGGAAGEGARRQGASRPTVKKRTLKQISDYWEAEATRNAAEAARWRRRCEQAERKLEALQSDPLATFSAAFRAEALRQIDAWPEGRAEVDQDARPQAETRGDDDAPADTTAA